MFKKVIGQESGEAASQVAPSQIPAAAPSPVPVSVSSVPVLKPAATPAPVTPANPAQAPAAPTPVQATSTPAPVQAGSSPAPSVVSAPVSAPPSNPVSSPPGVRNVLSTDVDIKGTVKFQDALIVDGKIEGEIQSTGSLTIGENAWIKAEVKTGTVVVYGKVHGNLSAIDKVELKASAEVVGDIKQRLSSSKQVPYSSVSPLSALPQLVRLIPPHLDFFRWGKPSW